MKEKYPAFTNHFDFHPKSILQDPAIINEIHNILQSNSINPINNWLRLDIESNEQTQDLILEQSDLYSLFSYFGEIEEIRMVPHQRYSANILYKDIVSAFFAQQALHQYSLPKIDAKIYLRWIQCDYRNGYNKMPETEELALTQSAPQPDTNLSDSSLKKSEKLEKSGSSEVPLKPVQNSNIKPTEEFQPWETYTKYTCRFEVQIENDAHYHVSRRLIGPKGCNMKKILRECTKDMHFPVPSIIKLRLRGRGSGFLEGPKQEECKEPLHLCISTCYKEKYFIAKQRVSELLLKIYADYKQFCIKSGKEVKDLKLKFTENEKEKPIKTDSPSSKLNFSSLQGLENDENVNPYEQQTLGECESYYYCYGQDTERGQFQ